MNFTSKDVQELYNQRKLDSLEFSELDTLFLMDIACLDPLQYGSGVYQARAMLDWDGFCLFATRSHEDIAIEEETINHFTSVYPNPTNGQLYIKSTECMEKIHLFNSKGIEISKFTLLDENQFDIQIASGLYIIQITLCDGTVEIHKVIGN